MTRIDGQPIVRAAEMRAAEAAVVAAGTTAQALMTRAGQAAAEQVRRLAAGAEVLVLCGPGNNGGDGYVIATALRQAGQPVRVAAIDQPRCEAAIAARAGWGGRIEALAAAEPAPVVVDALFGIGLTRPLDEAIAAPLARLLRSARLSIAIDLPSGVATDDAHCLNDLPPVDLTFALGSLKPAHVLQPAAARCGTARVVDIGVSVPDPVRAAAAPSLNTPPTSAHKYSRGTVTVVAGSMPGASALAATAAARAGAGYVLLLGSATDRLPHAIVRRRFSAEALADTRIGAVVIGPGLGSGDAAQARLYAALESGRPLVVDGDALRQIDGRRFNGRAILTPHAGEFAHLFGEDGGSKLDRALAAARKVEAIVVFKGADTVIAAPDGRVIIHADAPAWLSTAGTGDVLAGTIAARLAAGRDPLDAASEGVWLHAEAARRAGAAFIADDLTHHLPGAIAACL
ncbi:NAD(P)H-hydrate dehydratase [Sphingomonas sp. NBWT7]|uniref:NAD(P)H-hydrate dehydratase n=1 Tax=Sphingomonas sp. NBWT7 TaxID=2596913 RepID=UPI0016244F9C|nr:NAD(P)H-hydrate dehydratase [Sphingomonas sp. NBWT7]QNE30976.1 NAD(P)H-hydrate dehydratase [Sphingomonas sp. NBWT7]